MIENQTRENWIKKPDGSMEKIGERVEEVETDLDDNEIRRTFVSGWGEL